MSVGVFRAEGAMKNIRGYRLVLPALGFAGAGVIESPRRELRHHPMLGDRTSPVELDRALGAIGEIGVFFLSCVEPWSGS